MRTHQSDSDERELRPRSARHDAGLDAVTLAAAVGGRTDVLRSKDVLGLQRAVGNAGVGAMLDEERSPVHDVVSSGGGSPLAPEVRGDMESRLGHDFSDVKVHTDGAAHDSAKSVNAHAYTVGSNVVFQRHRYDPASTAGRTMLAHELTHVVQQRSGPVDGTATSGGIRVSDPSDRFEREASANAERAMLMPSPAPAAVSVSGPAVQREEDAPEEEETAQGSFVQREEEEEQQEEG